MLFQRGTGHPMGSTRSEGFRGLQQSPSGSEEGKECPEPAARGLSISPCPLWDAERGWAPWCGLNKGLGGASTVCSAPGWGAAVPKLPGILVSSMARNCLIYKQIILK